MRGPLKDPASKSEPLAAVALPPEPVPAPADGIEQSAATVFQQNWWIKAASDTGRYQEARVVVNGTTIGRLAYMVRRSKIGIRWAAAADWTHLSGPVLSPYLTRSQKVDVLSQLMAQLPRSMSCGFVSPGHTEDADLVRDAFKAAGFVHTLETTYTQSVRQADALGRLNRKHRLHIKAAARVLDVAEISADEFISTYAANLEAAGLRCHTPLDAAYNVMVQGTAIDPPQMRLLGARQKRPGAPLDAAIACPWDASRYYFWMSTRRREAGDGSDRPQPDAIKLLLIEAMAHARDLGLTFDADGVRTPGSITLYRDILLIPNEEFRDVFERQTRLARYHNIQVSKIKQVAARPSFKRVRDLALRFGFSL